MRQPVNDALARLLPPGLTAGGTHTPRRMRVARALARRESLAVLPGGAFSYRQ